MNVVFITAVRGKDPARFDGYQYSIESWRKWCVDHNTNLFILDEEITSIEHMNPNFFRYYCFDLLGKKYDKYCLVDADTIIHPDCPNFFDLHNPGELLAVHNDGDYDWVIRSIENYQHEFPEFDRKFDIWDYFNSGFLVFDETIQHLFEKFIEFFWKNREKILFCQKRYGVGTDQPLINLFINQHCPLNLKLVSYHYNMQELGRKGILDDRMLFLRIPGIYHFNGVDGGPKIVNYWLEKTLNSI